MCSNVVDGSDDICERAFARGEGGGVGQRHVAETPLRIDAHIIAGMADQPEGPAQQQSRLAEGSCRE